MISIVRDENKSVATRAANRNLCMHFVQMLVLGVSPQQDDSHEYYVSGLGISFSLMVNATNYDARNAGSITSIPGDCLIYSAKSRY